MSDPDLSEELQRALNEQTSAIESFEIVVAPFEHAEITLLEKNCIRVQVTKEGWQELDLDQRTADVQPFWSPKPAKTTTRRFETLDDLLRSASPLYAQKEADMITEKLNALLERE